MELREGKVTILFNHEGLTIALHDDMSSVTFATATLNTEQVCKAFSRLSHCDATIDVHALDKVGKVMEHKPLIFEMPKDVEYSERAKIAYDLALGAAPKGWTPDRYFGAQNSFFRKDGKDFARCTIRRWV